MSEADISVVSEHHAERIRAALIRAALDGYERAALSGLCCEGAWETAIAAMRQVDLRAVLASSHQR